MSLAASRYKRRQIGVKPLPFVDGAPTRPRSWWWFARVLEYPRDSSVAPDPSPARSFDPHCGQLKRDAVDRLPAVTQLTEQGKIVQPPLFGLLTDGANRSLSSGVRKPVRLGVGVAELSASRFCGGEG